MAIPEIEERLSLRLSKKVLQSQQRAAVEKDRQERLLRATSPRFTQLKRWLLREAEERFQSCEECLHNLFSKKATPQHTPAEIAERERLRCELVPRLKEIEWQLLGELKERFQPYLDEYGLECSILRNADVPRETIAQNLRETWQRVRGKDLHSFSSNLDPDPLDVWHKEDRPNLIFYHGNTGKRSGIFVVTPWHRYSDVPENPNLSLIPYGAVVESLEKVKEKYSTRSNPTYYWFGKDWKPETRNRESLDQDQALEFLKDRLVDYLESCKIRNFLKYYLN